MTGLDLQHFASSDPHVLLPACDHTKVYYSDLRYDTRLQALTEATKGRGMPLERDEFINLITGFHSLADVQRIITHLHRTKNEQQHPTPNDSPG